MRECAHSRPTLRRGYWMQLWAAVYALTTVYPDPGLTAAVLAACEHIRQDRRRKAKALNHPDMTEGLAAVLSISELQLTYELETAMTVD